MYTEVALDTYQIDITGYLGVQSHPLSIREMYCASSWAFSAIAAIESQLVISTGKKVDLSEQNLIDCSENQGTKGCSGGTPDRAYQYVIQNGGLDSTASYPYKGLKNACHYKPDKSAVITGYKSVQAGNEEVLKDAVYNIGPISVAIDASPFGFQFYSSGIFESTDCSNSRDKLNHALTITGYDVDGRRDIWFVKNSWDRTWGEAGFIT
ncbi:unnamed protein product [Oppiella nova]|uniref:Peptidase C1A papain C-terminal domain-containing protein n=1 Tax=Oppiella nova TaxID=334625 RepID=A0A7R9MIV6_9ACAR|nr:unnamed protein product [Oppiella nova]CAG2178066.1 unnamed protein product [Oppiella nova]